MGAYLVTSLTPFSWGTRLSEVSLGRTRVHSFTSGLAVPGLRGGLFLAASPRAWAPRPRLQWTEGREGTACLLTSSPEGPVVPGLPGSPSTPGSPWKD